MTKSKNLLECSEIPAVLSKVSRTDLDLCLQSVSISLSFYYSDFTLLNYFMDIIQKESAISVKQATIGTVFTEKLPTAILVCMEG